MIDSGRSKLAVELPKIFKHEKLSVELISVPHPRLESKVNKLFVQWQHGFNPATLIPFVSRAVDNKMDVYVALQVRVSEGGESALIFPGDAMGSVVYKKGLFSHSSFSDALEQTGREQFEQALTNAIESAAVNQSKALLP